MFLISEGRFHEFIMIKYNVLRGFFLFCFVFSSQISLSCQRVPFLFLAKLWKVGPDNPVHSYPIWKLLVLLSLDCRKEPERPSSERTAGRGRDGTVDAGAWRHVRRGILDDLRVGADQVFWAHCWEGLKQNQCLNWSRGETAGRPLDGRHRAVRTPRGAQCSAGGSVDAFSSCPPPFCPIVFTGPSVGLVPSGRSLQRTRTVPVEARVPGSGDEVRVLTCVRGSRGYLPRATEAPAACPTSAVCPSTAPAPSAGQAAGCSPCSRGPGGRRPYTPLLPRAVFPSSGLPVLLPPDPWPLTSTPWRTPEVHVCSSFSFPLSARLAGRRGVRRSARWDSGHRRPSDQPRVRCGQERPSLG